MTEHKATKLSAVQQKFILHWGEMGTRWGINRTVAQIHALLFLSPTPRHAEDIAATLGVARYPSARTRFTPVRVDAGVG